MSQMDLICIKGSVDMHGRLLYTIEWSKTPLTSYSALMEYGLTFIIHICLLIFMSLLMI